MFELAFISPPDMMVVAIVALLVFGPNRLPEVGRQVGTFLRDSKKMLSTFTDAINDVHEDVRAPFRDQPVPGEILMRHAAVPSATNPANPAVGAVSVAATPQLTISENATEDEPHETKSEATDQR